MSVAGVINDAIYGVAPDEVPCPITCLGHRHGVYFMASKAGEVRSGAARDLNMSGLISMFDGEIAWLQSKFPADSGRGLFDAASAMAYLVRECVARGVWDEGAPVRGPGTWRVGEAGIAVHCGDGIWHAGEWHPGGTLIGEDRYPTAVRLRRPDFEAALSAEEARRLLRGAIGRWNFMDALGPDQVIGWLACAYLGGAPGWRNHVILQAELGSGKSTLTRLVSAALGSAADRSQTNTSEAGTRKALSGEARAIILDESEGDEDDGGGHVRKMIGLIRRMSSGDGASTRRADGARAVEDRLTGTAWLAAILPPPLQPQDRSRFIIVRLAALDGRSAAVDVEAAIREIGKVSAALWARMIVGWGRFLDSFAAYRVELLERGCTMRQADLVATWMAGRDTMLEDEVLTPAAREAEMERIAPYLRGLMEGERGEGEGEECWRHLLSSPMESWQSGTRRSVGFILYQALNLGSEVEIEARGALKMIGVRILTASPDGDKANGVRVIAVANSHAGLARLFHGTRWKGGLWATALRMLPRSFVMTNPVRFAGALSRATAIDASVIGRDADDDPAEPPSNGVPEIGEEV